MLLRAIMNDKKMDDPDYSTTFRGLAEDDPLLVGASHEMSDCENKKKVNRWNMDSEDITDDRSRVKLQILEETQRKHSTINLDGFTHIGIWTGFRRMLSSLTLMVQEGESSRLATVFDSIAELNFYATNWDPERSLSTIAIGLFQVVFLSAIIPRKHISILLNVGSKNVIKSIQIAEAILA
jgi:hypothetical protein